MHASTIEHRRCSDAAEQLQADLRQIALDAMHGDRSTVPFVSDAGTVISVCTLSEMISRVMRQEVIAAELLRLLRCSDCPAAVALRATIASTYAKRVAPRIAALTEDA
jgi:hypothetical protein